uniref:LAS1 like ribosome biogenesis factor n=1 Tax=Acanthochromis polyacanthus TaxID=80966 RepID=A0A3Q1G4C6_9TELE
MKKKSSEKKRHVVAWVNKAEWDQVLEYLYSKDSSLQRFALHRISAWKGRYANSTPVAVDCTADLVRCQVLDRTGQLGGDDLVLLGSRIHFHVFHGNSYFYSHANIITQGFCNHQLAFQHH